jgi:hypothetical protein
MDGPDYRNHPERAVAALMIMLARWPHLQCPRLGDSIERHLVHVANDERLPAAVREAAVRIHREWNTPVAAEAAPRERLH